MKKTGLRITLAVVIALVSIMCSFGAVSAAPKSRSTSSITVSIDNITENQAGLMSAMTAPASGFDISYSWEKIGAWGYYITITDNSIEVINPTIYCQFYLLSSQTKSFNSDNPVNLAAAYSEVSSITSIDADPTHSYTIGLFLVKSNWTICASAYGDWMPVY